MKKGKSWFLRHKVISVVIAVLLFAVPLIVVNSLFKWKSNIYIIEAEWSAGDVLGYIAGFEAFIGTILLGIIAVVQNKKANDINDRLLQMQEESQRFKIKEKAAPVAVTAQITDLSKKYYVIKDDDVFDEYDVLNQKYKYVFFVDSPSINRDNRKLFNMVIELENISDIILKEIYIENFRLYDIITNNSGVSPTKEEIREYIFDVSNENNYIQCMLRPKDTIKICLKIGMDEYDLSKESFNVNFDLSTMSIYNVIFSENVNLFRNNVADEKDRVYVVEERAYFVNMPEAIEPYDEEDSNNG